MMAKRDTGGQKPRLLGQLRTVPISKEHYRRERQAEKERLRILEWDDGDKMTFPGFFTIHIDYCASGEGSTRGLTFCVASFYFASGAEIRQGLDPLPGYVELVPEKRP